MSYFWIIVGSALEAGILSLLGLVNVVYDKLPHDHDPLWDELNTQAASLSVAGSVGASIGMAYHLLVDGLVQVAPYHDIPVSMPMQAHQAIFVANGLGEAIDAKKKS